MPSLEIEEFIARWSPSGGGERSNYQLFLSELCNVIGVPQPEPAVPDDKRNAYVFDRSIPRVEADGTTTTNFIDLYKRGCFICETKQGVEQANDRSSLSSSLPHSRERTRERGALTKRGHGVRGTGTWDTAMEKARNQAEQYARSLPAAEGRPPFLLIVDVGYSLELFAEFTCTGGTYVRFPDPTAHRIFLTDLRDEKKLERLRALWTDPHSLDPAKRSAKVTREIATQLARLARSFEAEGREPQLVAEFLMRCIFTMFAEDVLLLPANSFKTLLESLKNNLRGFPVMIEALWRDMATGSSFSTVIREKVLYFNGGLFERASSLSVTAEQLELLLAAARADWRDVEPAIFGTLLERALSPRERHKLGAHYTPRAYVERLVFPTVIDPLRAEWETVKTAAVTLTGEADTAEAKAEELAEASTAIVKAGDAKVARTQGRDIAKLRKEASGLRREAVEEVRKFHHALCKTRVLDPACGSGNFLYVTMEHMKRLEGEALELLAELGDPQLETEMREFKVRPHQFIGLEINPWAVPIAELVLWIGYLQWHFRTSDKAVPDDPVISKEHSIRKQDAVLAYDKVEMITWGMARENPDLPGLPDEVREKLRRLQGDDSESHPYPSSDLPAPTIPITVWDGRTMKPHPVTGRDVPDDTARVPLWHYVNPRKAEWPEADYIVGNPPFLGASKVRSDLGDGYAESLRGAYKELPESCDFVMYWWDKAAHLLRDGKVKRFGFITTKAIGQTFNRRVVEPHLTANDPISIVYAIPNHPWVDSKDGADVRIAMTVAAPGIHDGLQHSVGVERDEDENGAVASFAEKKGKIGANLRIGVDLSVANPLTSNRNLSCEGMKPHGKGFLVSEIDARALGLDSNPSLAKYIKPYINGRDVAQSSRGIFIIDLFGLELDDVSRCYPEVFQWLLERVKPERDQNRRDVYKRNWWIFGEPRRNFRPVLNGLARYIVTVKTSKYRYFVFQGNSTLFDSKLIAIASEDAFALGVLSSSVHIKWAMAFGARLGIGDDPTYVISNCFNKFPFPDPDEQTRARIRALGEQLDAHRKRQQGLHPGLTLTGMYNVLEKLRAIEARSSRREDAQTPTAEESESLDLGSSELSAKEKLIHEQGLVSVLKQIHDDLDAAVFAAYGWSPKLTDDEILERLVGLNHERVAEEQRGQIRWLRPDFQCRDQTKQPVQTELIEPEDEAMGQSATPPTATRNLKLAWPKVLAEQVAAVSQALEATSAPVTAAKLASRFQRANRERLAEILETLVTLGRAQRRGDRFTR